MKKQLLLLTLMLGGHFLMGQSLVWESGPGVRPQNADLDPTTLNTSNLDTDFNGDGFADVVVSVIYRDSLFFQILLPDDTYQFHADDDFFSRSSQFLGYVKIPDIDGESVQENPWLVFGNTSGNRIIGVLVARVSEDGKTVTFEKLDAIPEYALLSVNDVNGDTIPDFLIFNRDSRRLQAWQFD